MDGELGARGRAARAPGRSAGCRSARRRGTPPLLAHSTCASLPRRSRLRRWLAGERRRRRSTPPAAARPVGSEAAPRACAACAHARQCTVRSRSGAASLAPGQPPDLISARPSAPTRLAGDVLCSRSHFFSRLYPGLPVGFSIAKVRKH
eukprot:scaffold28354_cov36-Phaeocystis_antarctica.AAC.1